MKKSVLIVIDCQKDFIDGSFGTPEAIEIMRHNHIIVLEDAKA